MDMVPAEDRARRVKEFVRRLRWKGPVFEISALAREGLQPLLHAIHAEVSEARRVAPPPDLRFDAVDDANPPTKAAG
jgi:GTP-binding protein